MPTMDSQRACASVGSWQPQTGPMRVLILGGTTEARAARGACSRSGPSSTSRLSLAGRTARPSRRAVPVRDRRLRRRRRPRVLSARGADRRADRRDPSVRGATSRPMRPRPRAQAKTPLLALRRRALDDSGRRSLDRRRRYAGRGRSPGQMPRCASSSRSAATSSRRSCARRSITTSSAASIRSNRRCDVPSADYIAGARAVHREADDRALIEAQPHRHRGGEEQRRRRDLRQDRGRAHALGMPVVMLRRPQASGCPARRERRRGRGVARSCRHRLQRARRVNERRPVRAQDDPRRGRTDDDAASPCRQRRLAA